LVEEILRRIEENDLYVKPELCIWRVREVEFLGVIILWLRAPNQI